jgi:hypothetical protein
MIAVAIPAAAQDRPPEPRGEAQGAPFVAQQRVSEPPAEAQATPSAGATHPVKFAIDGLSPGLQVRIVPGSERGPDGAAKPTVCTEDCELELQKGTYTLIASRGDEHRTKEIALTSSQILKVGQWDGVARTTGIVMGITGILVGAVGAFITVGSYLTPSPGPDDEDLDNTGTVVALAGMAGLAVGTGLAIGGFSLAAANRAPSMDLERMPTTRLPAPGAGAGISLSGKF